jgi:DNA repair protein RadA/Sms
MLVAVVAKHLRLPMGDYDIYLNVASGYKISEPAADLGICLSIISSFKNLAMPAKTVVIGEVGLLGEIRSVPQEAKRIKEARKLGFSNILSSNQKTLSSLARTLFE